MKKSQRFIAGATCPRCKEIDSLLVDMDDQSIECVECGFTQTEAERDAEQASKPDGTVAKAVPKKVEVSDIIRVKNVRD